MDLEQSPADQAQASDDLNIERQRITLFQRQAETFCHVWHEQIERWRKKYDFDHFGYKPKQGETLYADPTYGNVVDLAVGVLLANQLDWNVIGFNPSLREERDTSRIEKFLAGVTAYNSEREEYSIPYEVILNFVRDGAGVIYQVWDGGLEVKGVTDTQIVDPEDNTRTLTVPLYTNMPLRQQVIDPMDMYLIPGGIGRWSKMFRIQAMTVWDAEQLFGVKLSKYEALNAEQKMTTNGKMIDFWELTEKPETFPDTPEGKAMAEWYKTQSFALKNAIMFDDQFIHPLRLMPGYEDYPYTIGFFKPVGRVKAEEWGHSIIRPLESSVELLEKSVNRRQHQIDVYSSLPIVTKTLPGRQVTVDPGIANVISLSTEEDLGFPQWPGNPPDVQMQLDFLRSRVQQSGFSDVVFGSGQNSGSGYALSQLGDQNRIRLTQPVEHLNLFWTKLGQKAVKLAVHFAGEGMIQVYGNTRGKNFADNVQGTSLGGYRITAEVHPVFPNEETRKHALATQVKGVLSDHLIMERYLGVKQPDDDRKRRLQEQAMNHPVMQRYIMIAALQELADTDDDLAAKMVIQQMQQELVQAQQGRPSEPNAAQQPLGTASSTGLPTPQEMGGQPAGQSELDQLGQMAGSAPNMQGGV